MTKFIEKLVCFLGIHNPKNIHKLGILTMGKCNYCKKEIMQDSQGNWF